MASDKDANYELSRRAFLRGMRWTPLLFLPAPLQATPFWPSSSPDRAQISFTDFRVTPHYPAKSPLDDVLRYVSPGSDEYVTEKYASEVMLLLMGWGRALRLEAPALPSLGKFVGAGMESSDLASTTEIPVRSDGGIEIVRRRFANQASGREQFLDQIKSYLTPFSRLETAEFEMVGIEQSGGSSITARIRYDLVGVRHDKTREGRIGYWLTQWSRADSNWRMHRLEATEETVTRTREPIFLDVTSHALGQNQSFRNQMAHGADYWRTILDGAAGLDVYGNNGVAVGDFDHSGFDSLYVCQPAGLPNRLYRNRGDGTFEDVTEASGVGVLDSTACALFADFDNKGLQDLLVVCGNGPLLFLNQGNGKFSLKRDAFKFAQPPQGTFTHAAIADYDNDGRLDVYFCLYSYYLGLDQYHYPAPYFDARNGPPNFLLHNEGDATFHDRTEAAGLNVDNDRYSFACAWGDSNSNGLADLYVANDFGRSNLYRNDGNGKFTAVSTEAGVEDPGAGMSACWFDFDGDGKQDIYVANMWSAAGMRVSGQGNFRKSDPEDIRGLYHQHAQGNSLYRNLGNGKFKNVSQEAGAETGRWAWSSDSWDFDHDGHPDLYIANGYISGPDARDLSSFFWRQVVANSPATATPSLPYEQGWNAINELIRSDSSWSGSERNVFYINNRDGTFSEASGVTALDFPDDSRAFALADLDHDGRLEVILKNRNAPQLRIVRNAMSNIGNSIAFCLRGTKSNRDAIGVAVTVAMGEKRQTKYLQAGSGFLSQHTKELFFGVGTSIETVRATVHWPSGLTQTFEHIPINCRIEIEEGTETFSAKPFAKSPASYAQAGESQAADTLPTSGETWLINPLSAPDFSLPDLNGNLHTLQSFRGKFLLLNFWANGSPSTTDQLSRIHSSQSLLAAVGVRVLAVNVDNPGSADAVRSLAAKHSLSFPVLLATPEIVGIYNIIYRYLFDRRRDLGLPASFLVDGQGMIVKVYQGPVNLKSLAEDVKAAPRTPAERTAKSLPFPGTLYQSTFQRNDFTYGVAMFQRGYLNQAAASFRQVIAAKPEDPGASYNLGTLELRRNNLAEARRYLEHTVKLKPNYPEAWNNLGMLAAQEGHNEEAVRNFLQSLALRPAYTVALLNLGNLQRRLGAAEDAEKLLTRAIELEPENPEVNYGLGMLYARQDHLDRATRLLEKSVSLRPDYADALNNLGVLYVRQNNYSIAEQKFQACIKAAPNFDQAYLNLARVYVLLNDKQKAREALQALLRLQPQHKTAQQALEMLN
jgi:Flp pilus assembly protein TadD/peroxiredoxin